MHSSKNMPVIFVSHGAATLTMNPNEQSYASFAELANVVAVLHPRAIVMVSAHDERNTFTVSTAAQMTMVPDHPAAVGHVWSGKGEFEVQERIVNLLSDAGVGVARGTPILDHGAWVALIHLFPEARIPLVTISIRQDGDTSAHFALGEVLEPLSREGILILASGGATHNQDSFRASYFKGNTTSYTEDFSERFDNWVRETLALAREDRKRALLAAGDHQDYDLAHPTPDHWTPLLVAAGAAGQRRGVSLQDGFQHTLSMAAYIFE